VGASPAGARAASHMKMISLAIRVAHATMGGRSHNISAMSAGEQAQGRRPRMNTKVCYGIFGDGG
jgi:hypothetical protein